MADEDWDTYFFEAHYPYDDGGTRADCVIAPDRDTARRLAAVQCLEDNGDTLASQGAPSLLEYYGDAPFRYSGFMEIMAEWGDLDGTACPNCTAHCGQPNGNHVELDGATREVHQCSSCDYRWVPLGHDPVKRAEAIEATKREIAQLDLYEQISLIDLDKLGLSEMNLDTAVDLFRQEQDAETAKILRLMVERYHLDEMIEDGTKQAYLDETEPFLKEEAVVEPV